VAVLRFKPLDLRAGGRLRELRQPAERREHGHLVLYVQIRPALPAFEYEFALGPASPEHLGNTVESLWSLTEA